MTEAIRRPILPSYFAPTFRHRCPCQADAKDWPMYNHDVIGTRHNPGETAIGRDNAGRLEEKWRFPGQDSGRRSGSSMPRPSSWTAMSISARPPIRPSTSSARWEAAWSYRAIRLRGGRAASGRGSASGAETSASSRHRRHLGLGARERGHGLLRRHRRLVLRARPGDRGGAWKLNARAEDFPGAHPINVFMASPILADGKLIVAGGTLEQLWPPGSSIVARRAAVLSWPSSRRPAGSCGSTTLAPSPSP